MANNARDARQVVIPIGTGLVGWRLIQYYWIRNQKPEIMTSQIDDLAVPAIPEIKAPFNTPKNLIEGFRCASGRLWFAFLFWPLVLCFVFGLFLLDQRKNLESKSVRFGQHFAKASANA